MEVNAVVVTEGAVGGGNLSPTPVLYFPKKHILYFHMKQHEAHLNSSVFNGLHIGKCVKDYSLEQPNILYKCLPESNQMGSFAIKL